MDNFEQNTATVNQTQQNTKFCKHCGQKISEAAVICPVCGCQVEELKSNAQAPIVINNTNTNTNTNVNKNINASGNGNARNKWVAFFLCFFLGYMGAHKFYEGKIGRGILYIFTFGLLGIGWLIDLIAILGKPNPYYV
ncbi:MAG: NINE protein [Clostridia bacterium]|nr:NINE protein [Clostridia bacterium]